MGLLRILLALSVVLGHSAPLFGWQMMKGLPAVQTFYMISGFYIAMILSDKYTGAGSLKAFYINRALRLYPTFWIVLAATWLIGQYDGFAAPWLWLNQRWAFWSQHFGFLEKLSIVGTNFLLLFQDWFFFLGVHSTTSKFVLTWGANSGFEPAYRFLVVPQAWTLGIEVTFYLIAPWLLRRSFGTLVITAGVSLAIRFALASYGHHQAPWSYQFFPSELLFFVVGALAYRAHKEKRRGLYLPLSRGRFGFLVVIALTVGFQWIYGTNVESPAWFYYLPVLYALPAVFEWTKKSKLDRWVGELSYPLYLSHVLLTQMIAPPAGADFTKTSLYALQIILLSLLCSVLLRLLVQPIEKVRDRRAKSLLKRPALRKSPARLKTMRR